MKFKYIVWLIALILTAIVCSCSTKKKNSERLKEKETVKTSEDIKIKESLIDNSTFEEWLKESNYVIKLIQYFPFDSSGKQPYKTETEISNTEKESTKKQTNDLTQNKAVEAQKDSSGAKSRLGKKKSTATSGVGTGKVIGVGIVFFAFLLAVIAIWVQIKKKRAANLLKNNLHIGK